MWGKIKAISKQNKSKNVIPNLFRDLSDELGKESTPSDNQEKQNQERHPEFISGSVGRTREKIIIFKAKKA